MTDMSKYKNVSLTKQTYKTLESLSKVLLPDAKLSVSKTIESLANEKAKKLNGKIKNK
jgi:exopolysaccharide biosynthesis protein